MIGLPLYLLQIVLNFFTIDMKSSEVFGIKYLTWKTLHLIIDIIAFLPFFLISHAFLILKLVRIVKFTTLIENLLKMVTAFIEYFGFSKKDGLIQASKNFIQFTLYLFYAAHFFSCFWIWIGKESEDSWISASQELIEDTESNFDLYISSFYLIITIFASVGYGDFNWGLDHELIYLFIVKLCGIGIFGYIFGNIGNIIKSVDNIQSLKNENDEMLNVWLIKLSKIHNEKVMSPDYFTYIQKCQNEHWHQDVSSVSESIFFKQLKPSIQEELLDYLNKHIYEEFEEFFEGHEHKFIRE